MRVSFLNPGNSTEPFFGKMAAFMSIAARQLGIELEIAEGHRQRSRMIEEGEALLSRSPRPEYLILVNEQNVAVGLLPRAVALGIKVMLINEGFMTHEYQTLGWPRGKLDSWLGELLPDDQQAGFLLGDRLIDLATRRGRVGGDGSLHVVGLAGDYSTSSIQRVSGLSRAVKARPGVTLDTVRLADWDHAKARALTASLLESFPETTVVWAASDLMAAGAIEAIAAAGRLPGEDVVVGGVDWAPLAYEQIREGRLSASAGGHFMEGTWALVLLYDHHHGRDFAATRARSEFVLLSDENVEEYSLFFHPSRWPGIDFRRLSKVLNPALESYEFSPQASLRLSQSTA